MIDEVLLLSESRFSLPTVSRYLLTIVDVPQYCSDTIIYSMQGLPNITVFMYNKKDIFNESRAALKSGHISNRLLVPQMFHLPITFQNCEHIINCTIPSCSVT